MNNFNKNALQGLGKTSIRSIVSITGRFLFIITCLLIGIVYMVVGVIWELIDYLLRKIER